MALTSGEGGKRPSPFMPDGSVNPDFGRGLGDAEAVIDSLMYGLGDRRPAVGSEDQAPLLDELHIEATPQVTPKRSGWLRSLGGKAVDGILRAGEAYMQVWNPGTPDNERFSF